jgi:hypothetical protein
LAVDAQPVQRGRQPEEHLTEAGAADRLGLVGGVLGDEHVRVGGVGPARPPVGEPVEQGAAGELVQRAGATGDGQSAVAEVEVVQEQAADGQRPGGVDSGQRQHQPLLGSAGGCGGDGLVDVALLKRDQHGIGVAADADAAGWVAEDRPAALAAAKQGPQCGERGQDAGCHAAAR